MKIDVSHIAQLANLPLTDKEKKTLARQLDETLAYIEELNEIKTKNTEPTNQVTGLESVVAEDISQSSLSQRAALTNAKTTHNNLFKVKGIFEDE